MIDAHAHLNMHSSDIGLELRGRYEKVSLEGMVLILNSQEEINWWSTHFREFQDLNICISIIFDFRDVDKTKRNLDFFCSNDINSSLKIHTRLSDICLDDINKIIGGLSSIDGYKNIICDYFYYGTKIRNQIVPQLVEAINESIATDIVIAHYGGTKVLETMLDTRKNPNIYYDISLSPVMLKDTSVWADLKHSIAYTKDKVMWGSDSPDIEISQSVLVTDTLLADFSEEEKKAIFTTNAKRIYGI